MMTTKTGDDGKSRFMGRVVDKDSPLLETVGEIDEFQAVLELIGVSEKIINDMGQVMGELSCEVKFENYDLRIKQLEKEIGEMEKKRPKFNEFLKFKTDEALKFNWARTVCRRVERRLVALSKEQEISENNLIYFNRLSDYLFLKAVLVN